MCFPDGALMVTQRFHPGTIEFALGALWMDASRE
jgi:hypothetical protein